jgi:hypothetical protein
MMENPRYFEVGPDPFGKTWLVQLRWMQTAISIRHADAIDVKFQLTSGDQTEEKVVAISHPHLLQLAEKLNRPLTDPWCMKLAALHLKEVIQTGEDIEKMLVACAYSDLERHAKSLAN